MASQFDEEGLTLHAPRGSVKMRGTKKLSKTKRKPLKAHGRSRVKKKDKISRAWEKIRREREAVLSDEDAEFVREGLASGRIHFLENM